MPAEAGLSGMGCPLLIRAINWGEVLAVFASIGMRNQTEPIGQSSGYRLGAITVLCPVPAQLASRDRR
jgi:hypothetical protein